MRGRGCLMVPEGRGPGQGRGRRWAWPLAGPRAGAGGLGWALCWAKASGPVGFCKYLNTGRTIFGGYGLSPGLAGCRAGCRVTAASPHTPLRPRLPGPGCAAARCLVGFRVPPLGTAWHTEAPGCHLQGKASVTHMGLGPQWSP